jgi:hypothetical protein
MIIAIPAEAKAREYHVLLPRLFSAMPTSVNKQSTPVIVIVNNELCVRETSITEPSPQSKAVPVNAMTQKGHFGKSASKSPVMIPKLLRVPGDGESHELHVVFILWQPFFNTRN